MRPVSTLRIHAGSIVTEQDMKDTLGWRCIAVWRALLVAF
jgi:hypothetical protein